jgi:hypothetical protein
MNNETYGVTAKRIAKGSKKVVVVTFADGSQKTLGGARAERATAVVICQGAKPEAAPHHWWYDLHVVGLRSDASKAAAEARGLLHPAPPRRSRLYLNVTPRQPALKAAAIPVED